MANKVKPIPDGHHSVTPYLILSNAAKGIEFYKSVFGATELMRINAPGGKIGHAELQLGDSRIMLADKYPQMGARSPQSIGGTPVSLALYVEDVDSVAQRALAAGANGDRSGTFTDPFGHQWTIATHKEDVSPEEIERGAAAMFGSKA